MRLRLLNKLAALVLEYPRAIVVMALLVAAACGIYAGLTLQLNTNTDDLIRPDRPFMAEYRRFQETFGDLEFIHVVVDSHGNTAAAEACVGELTRRLRDVPDLRRVDGGVEPVEQMRVATRVMAEEELAGLVTAGAALPILAGNPGPATILAEAETMLGQLVDNNTPRTPEEQESIGAAAFFLLGAIGSVRDDAQTRDDFAGLRLDAREREYLVSETGRLYFVQVMPDKDYGTLAVFKEPLARIRAVLDEVRARHPDVEIGLTGKPVLQADEMATTDRDMKKAAFIAVTAVSLLFIFMIGGIRRPVLAVIAFACAAAWNYGLATAVYGQLNLLSIVFVLVLIGVGMDYGVHVMARHREYRAAQSGDGAIRSVMRTAVQGNFTGVLCSSTVFLMALLTSFQGLRELGLIAGSGLLLCFVAMTLVLPSLLVLSERRRAFGRKTKTPQAADYFRFLNVVIQYPRRVLLVTLLVTAASVPLAFRAHFEQNVLNLQAQGLESVEWQHRLSDDSASATWFGALIENDLSDVADAVQRAEAKPNIGRVRSVLDVIELPTAAREAALSALPRVENVAAPASDAGARRVDPTDLRRVIDKLRQLATLAAVSAPERAEAFRPLVADQVELLRAMLAEERDGVSGGGASIHARLDEHAAQIGAGVRAMLEGNAMTLRDAVPEAARDQMVSPDGHFLVMMHPAENVWDFEPMRLFIEDMRAVDPDVTGVPITHFESLIDMRQAFRDMTLLAIAAVVLILLADYRNVAKLLLTLVPVGVGILWTVTIIGALNIPFSLANFFAIPILVGLSADASIHIMHRYREGGPHRLDLGATRQAVILTACTTIIGFGCLMLAQHRGLRSLGVAMAIGSTAGLFATIIILPALLAWCERLRGGRPLGTVSADDTRV